MRSRIRCMDTKDLERIFRTCGVKVTHQRMQIFQELVSTDEHPDAETIYSRVRKHIPAISLDTVYRTLRLFEAKGLIMRVGAIADSARYDATVDLHGHFVCTGCGRIFDVDGPRFQGLDKTPSIQGIGHVNSIYIELRGICNKCKSRKGRG